MEGDTVEQCICCINQPPPWGHSGDPPSGHHSAVLTLNTRVRLRHVVKSQETLKTLCMVAFSVSNVYVLQPLTEIRIGHRGLRLNAGISQQRTCSPRKHLHSTPKGQGVRMGVSIHLSGFQRCVGTYHFLVFPISAHFFNKRPSTIPNGSNKRSATKDDMVGKND